MTFQFTTQLSHSFAASFYDKVSIKDKQCALLHNAEVFYYDKSQWFIAGNKKL